MLETVVRRALCRRERLSTPDAPVSTAFPGPRSVESVADDASGTDSSVEHTSGIETSAILQFGLALVDERTASLDIGLKLYHAHGLGPCRQQFMAEAPNLPPSALFRLR